MRAIFVACPHTHSSTHSFGLLTHWLTDWQNRSRSRRRRRTNNNNNMPASQHQPFAPTWHGKFVQHIFCYFSRSMAQLSSASNQSPSQPASNIVLHQRVVPSWVEASTIFSQWGVRFHLLEIVLCVGALYWFEVNCGSGHCNMFDVIQRRMHKG